jgi:hypothetical protein
LKISNEKTFSTPSLHLFFFILPFRRKLKHRSEHGQIEKVLRGTRTASPKIFPADSKKKSRFCGLLLGVLPFGRVNRFFQFLSSDRLAYCIRIGLSLLAISFIAFLAHLSYPPSKIGLLQCSVFS